MNGIKAEYLAPDQGKQAILNESLQHPYIAPGRPGGNAYPPETSTVAERFPPACRGLYRVIRPPLNRLFPDAKRRENAGEHVIGGDVAEDRTEGIERLAQFQRE